MFVSATLAAIGQTGGGDRIRDIREPAHTTVSKQEDCLVGASLIQYHTEQGENVRGQELGGPLLTVDASNRYGLVAASLTKYYSGEQQNQDITDPLHTITTKDREGLTVASLSKYFGGVVGAEMSQPLPTVTAVDHNALQTAHLVKLKGENLGEYESEARAMEVLGEIADEYGKYLSTAGGPLATVEAYVQPFAYAPPKVYKMPER